MLRRKLLSRVGLLVCAFVAGAVVALWLLQDVLGEIEHANADAAALIDGIQTVEGAITHIEAARFAQGAGGSIDGSAATLTAAMDRLGSHAITRDGAAAAAFARARDLLPAFLEHGSATRDDPGTVTLHGVVQELGRIFRAHVAAQQVHIGRYFRAMVLCLTLAALVMINVAIFVLMRIAQMVLKPVGALVQGSRELAAEHFDHRVVLEQKDEFGELALAYNSLAEQLQASEQRKAETLRQLAVTLNHDLNNAMSIIELQLGMLDRQAGGNPTLGKHLCEIRTTLGRMTGTVSSLKHIRRVVLTDYAPGQKMVDLERSVADSPDPPAAHRPTVQEPVRP